MNAKDVERLARIRKGMEGRTRYERQEERDDEFLLRLFDEAVWDLEDCLRQACWNDTRSDTYDSIALSAYAEGLRFLADLGKFKIEQEFARRVIGKFVDKKEKEK